MEQFKMDMSDENASFPFVLDHKPGFLLGSFLYRLFRRARFDENMTEQLREMNRHGTVVYAIKYRGKLDYLLYHYRFRRARMPYPKVSFDMNMTMLLPMKQVFRMLSFYLSYIARNRRFPSPFETGFLERTIKNGTCCLISLVDSKGFTRRFIHEDKDYLQFLVEIQKTMDAPIFIVPQLILYKSTPEREKPGLKNIFFGYKDKPGCIRKIVLFFRHNRKAFIDFGTPVDLKTYLAERTEGLTDAQIARELRSLLIDRIDAQKRIILGPVMKSRQQLKETVLQDPKIMEAIREEAGGGRKKLMAVRKKAGGYFDEIAADYNQTYVQFGHMILSRVWKRLFDGIDVVTSELGAVREYARRGPLIYIPSHKSHVDYLALNYILFEHHMHIPRIAAGRNLAFWPMGNYFRKAGAFFIRRSFSGAKLYSRVFSRYIRALLQEGHPLEFYIEGGRSRSGKLILPKIGFLSILIEAFNEGYCDDLVFVPASIVYDRIPEERAYLNEMDGGVKEAESFKQMLKARHFLKRSYGKIYIRFGKPVSFKEYLDSADPETHQLHRQLALDLIRSINDVTLVTPLALVASAVLTTHRRGFHLPQLVETAGLIHRFLKSRSVPTAATLSDIEQACKDTLDLLISWKVATALEDIEGEERFYFVDDDKKPELEYYKNSIIHATVTYAFVAVSLLSGAREVLMTTSLTDDYKFMKHLFRNEFIYSGEDDDDREVDSILAYFTAEGLVEQDTGSGQWHVTRPGYDILPTWAGFAKTFIEAYWIAARTLSGAVKQGDAGRGDILKKMHNNGIRYYRLGIVDHREAASHLLFKNASAAVRNGRPVDEADETSEHLSAIAHRLYELVH
jgi:glycerol-3-phosphate O-acyltransferase